MKSPVYRHQGSNQIVYLSIYEMSKLKI